MYVSLLCPTDSFQDVNYPLGVEEPLLSCEQFQMSTYNNICLGHIAKHLPKVVKTCVFKADLRHQAFPSACLDVDTIKGFHAVFAEIQPLLQEALMVFCVSLCAPNVQYP